MTKSANYGRQHQAARANLLEDSPLCAHCGLVEATVADHQPPIALHDHARGSGCCEYLPSCLACSQKQAGAVSKLVGTMGATEVVFAEPPPSPGPEDSIWDSMPWLESLREVPPDGTWPRWMSLAHPLAIGTYLDEFERFVDDRTGARLHWFQRLAAARLLEYGIDGRLVWLKWWLSIARQVGKSWLVVELLIFVTSKLQNLSVGATETGLTSRKLGSSEDIIEPLIRWADDQSDWKTSKSKGGKHVELPNRNRIIIRSIDSAFGLSLGYAIVDEAWDVNAADVVEGLEPTLLSTEGQLGVTSTAHRKATSFALNLRDDGFEQLDEPSTLLVVEWAASRDRDLADVDGWREASPRWTKHRETYIADRLRQALSGQLLDPTEPDPVAAFEAQMLNRWPVRQTRKGRGEALLEPGEWATSLVTSQVPVMNRVAAIEDNYGKGLAVVVAGVSATGRIAVTARQFDSRSEGWTYAAELDDVDQYLVGGSMMGEPGARALFPLDASGTKQTRAGISVLRALLQSGELTHDGSVELAEQVVACRVRQGANGLVIVSAQRHDAVNAMSWAVGEVHRRRGQMVDIH